MERPGYRTRSENILRGLIFDVLNDTIRYNSMCCTGIKQYNILSHIKHIRNRNSIK